MPSLGSILQIARSGLIFHQHAMNVTSHNIANASTEGYSRQRPIFAAMPAVRFPNAVYGTGVTITDVQRVADPLLDAAIHREVANTNEHGARAGVLERIEALFGEPTELGLGASLDTFFSDFSELASNPISPSVRTALRQDAAALTDRFRTLTARLDTFRQETEARMQGHVDRANEILAGIAEINRRIVPAELDDKTAGDLRDARGRLVDELASILPIQTIEQQDGSLGVRASGVSLVDHVTAGSLELRQVGGVWRVAKVGLASPLADDGGTLGGLMEVVNTDLPSLRQGLDDLAEALVTEVNTIHQTGTNPAGATGVDFFDPAGITASSIALSAAVLAGTDAIAAGTPDGVGAYRAGANDVALGIAGLRDTSVPLLGATMGEHYDGLVLDVANRVRSSADAAQVHRTLADQAEIRRMSLSGVSVDEELVKMIEFQTAYQAAARVITTADEMLQSLISM